MTLEELRNILVTYGANPEEREAEVVVVHEGDEREYAVEEVECDSREGVGQFIITAARPPLSGFTCERCGNPRHDELRSNRCVYCTGEQRHPGLGPERPETEEDRAHKRDMERQRDLEATVRVLDSLRAFSPREPAAVALREQAKEEIATIVRRWD